jgi:hypothetical protein
VQKATPIDISAAAMMLIWVSALLATLAAQFFVLADIATNAK